MLDYCRSQCMCAFWTFCGLHGSILPPPQRKIREKNKNDELCTPVHLHTTWQPACSIILKRAISNINTTLLFNTMTCDTLDENKICDHWFDFLIQWSMMWYCMCSVVLFLIEYCNFVTTSCPGLKMQISLIANFGTTLLLCIVPVCIN